MTDKLTKRFPIQGGFTVSRLAAEHAYKTYSTLFGTSQSLDRLAERGGFSLFEFAILFRGGNPCLCKCIATEDELKYAISKSNFRVVHKVGP